MCHHLPFLGFPRPPSRLGGVPRRRAMAAPRPCRICRRWFRPDPKVGDRQHACSDPACRKEAHRRACRKWRGEHQRRIRIERFEARLVEAEAPGSPESDRPVDPLKRINWDLAAREVGEKTGTLVAVAMRLILRWPRETSLAQSHDNKGVVPKVIRSVPRETSSGQPAMDRAVPSKVIPSARRDEMAAPPLFP